MLLDGGDENTFDKIEPEILDAKFLVPWHGQRRDDISVKIILKTTEATVTMMTITKEKFVFGAPPLPNKSIRSNYIGVVTGPSTDLLYNKRNV